MLTGASNTGTEVVAGSVYRDLDGSLVQLLNIERDLCHWVAMMQGPSVVQITHIDNFRRRFRAFETSSSRPVKLSA